MKENHLLNIYFKIEDFSMIPSKDCKALLYNMLNDGLLCLTVTMLDIFTVLIRIEKIINEYYFSHF
jgi:hypothetical protein